MARQDEDELPEEDDPDFEHEEREQASSGPTPPSALLIHEIIRADGEDELDRSTRSLLWSAVAAGLSMGFSFLTMAIIKSKLPEAPWSKLLTSFGYTIGFLIVVLGRQQLYTESTLTAVLPMLTRRDWRTTYKTVRLSTIVLALNLVGTVLFAWLLSHEALFDQDVNEALRTLASEAIKDSFWPMLIKGILAGWLIALMVWLIPGAGQARFFLILLLTYVVAIAQFSHIIAGSVEAAFNVFVGHIEASAYLTHFAIPTFIGNTIGGASLVAILNHAAVSDELKKEKKKK